MIFFLFLRQLNNKTIKIMDIYQKNLQIIADEIQKRNEFNLRSFNLGVSDCKIGIYNASIESTSCFSRELYDMGWLSFFNSNF